MSDQSSASFRSSSAMRASTPAICPSRQLELGRCAPRGSRLRDARRPLRPRRLGLDRRACRVPLALQVGPAAVVRAQRAVLERDDAVGHGVQERAVVGDEEDRPRERLERGLERLARLDVEMVRRLVEDEEVDAGRDQQRECEPPPLSTGERGHGPLVRLPAGEEEPPEQRLRARARQPRRGGRRIEHRSARRQLDRVLGEVAGHDSVAETRSSRRRAGGRRGSRRGASSCPSRSARRGRPSRRARSRSPRRRAARFRPPRARRRRPRGRCGRSVAGRGSRSRASAGASSATPPRAGRRSAPSPAARSV